MVSRKGTTPEQGSFTDLDLYDGDKEQNIEIHNFTLLTKVRPTLHDFWFLSILRQATMACIFSYQREMARGLPKDQAAFNAADTFEAYFTNQAFREWIDHLNAWKGVLPLLCGFYTENSLVNNDIIVPYDSAWQKIEEELPFYMLPTRLAESSKICNILTFFDFAFLDLLGYIVEAGDVFQQEFDLQGAEDPAAGTAFQVFLGNIDNLRLSVPFRSFVDWNPSNQMIIPILLEATERISCYENKKDVTATLLLRHLEKVALCFKPEMSHAHHGLTPNLNAKLSKAMDQILEILTVSEDQDPMDEDFSDYEQMFILSPYNHAICARTGRAHTLQWSNTLDWTYCTDCDPNGDLFMDDVPFSGYI